MPTCPYCGGQNSQADAIYCSYCGSNLGQQQNAAPPPRQQFGSPPPNYPASGRPTFDLSIRYEKALKRAEQLGYVVIIMAVAVLLLLFIP